MSPSHLRLFAASTILWTACATGSADNGAAGPSPALLAARVAAHTPTAVALAPGPATTPTGAAPVKVTSVEGITEYRLANGLQVLLFPDPSKPTVTVNITVLRRLAPRGLRRDRHGPPARAHAVQGHAHPPRHLEAAAGPRRPVQRHHLVRPHQLLRGAARHAREPRVRHRASRPTGWSTARIAAEDLAKEFSVVRNEFEMGENDPAGVLEERMFAAAYQWHNYGKSTIGSRSDIERVPVDNLRAFYRKYYQPDNAMLVVAGKFDEAQGAGAGRSATSAPSPARRASCRRPTPRSRCRTASAAWSCAAAATWRWWRLLYHGGGRAPIPTGSPSTPSPTSSPTSRPVACTRRWWRRAWPARCSATSTRPPSRACCSSGPRCAPGGSPEKVRDALIKVGGGSGRRRRSPTPRWSAGGPRSLKEFELALTDTAQIGRGAVRLGGDGRLAPVLPHPRPGQARSRPADVTRVAKDYLHAVQPHAGHVHAHQDARARRRRRPGRRGRADEGLQGRARRRRGGGVRRHHRQHREAHPARRTLPGGLELALPAQEDQGRARCGWC